MPYISQADLLSRLSSGKLSYANAPTTSPRSVKFFIASVYSDFKVEREALKQRVYPELIEYGKSSYGLDIEIIDPHETDRDIRYEGDYLELFNELRNTFCHCSVNCCPVILMGQKYGLPILPRRIPSRIFQLLMSTLRAHRNHITREYHLVNVWYKMDDNALPDSVHVLQHQDVVLKGKDMENEWPQQKRLLATLLKMGFVYCLQEGTIDQASVENLLVFELETAVNQSINSSILCQGKYLPILLRREIVDIENYLNAENVADFVDVETTAPNNANRYQLDDVLAMLHSRMETRLLDCYPYAGNAYQILWRFPSGVEPRHHAEYLNSFCDEFKRSALQAIDDRGGEKVLHENRLHTQVFDTCYNSLVRSAILHKYAMGHEDTMSVMLEYCYSNNTQPFVVHGPATVGKSVVMSGVYAELVEISLSQPATLLLHRVYVDRCSVSEMVESLYQQVAMHCHYIGVSYSIPSSKSLQDFLLSLPESLKVIILISGFERIVDDFGIAISLSSVFPAALPKNVKFVVTFLNMNALEERFSGYRVRQFTYSEYDTFLKEHLQAQGRQLAPEQWNQVRGVISSVQNYFHLGLLAHHLLELSSFSSIPVAALMGESLDQAVEYTFHILEKKYGSVIISQISRLISASQDGLTDNELMDLLSLDDTILLHETEVNLYPLTEDTFHFSRSKFLSIKRDMSLLLTSFSRDAFYVSYWTLPDIAEVAHRLYIANHERRVKELHLLMNEYYEGRWHQCFKPVKTPQSDEALDSGSEGALKGREPLIDRLVPSQEIMYGTELTPHFNVRLYRQLPRHLTAVGAVEQLHKKVLFNYEWIYYKTKCLGLNELISDYQSMAETNVAIALVLQAIEKSRPILEENMDSLAAELIGQILAFSSMYEDIRYLVQQCDVKGPKHNGLLPSFSYPTLPGSALENVLNWPTELQSYFVDTTETLLMLKMDDDNVIYQYDLQRHELSELSHFSHGKLVATHSKRYAILLDGLHENYIKIHEKKTGQFLGSVIPTNWIELRPFETKNNYKVTNIDVSDNLMSLILSYKASYVFIVDLQTCAPIHMFRPEKLATLSKLSADGTFLFTNSGQQLVGFNIASKEQTALIDLLAIPKMMIHSRDMHRAFILCDQEQVVVNLHLRQGHVEMSYKVVFEKSLVNDTIRNIELSSDDQLLLVQGKQNILVYEFGKDTIICHFKRPMEIPRYFKLPNCDYMALNFTCARFAMENKAVIASIFRNILIWSVESSSPLALLHAPVGIIDNFLVCHERKCLIGYVSTMKSVLLWNLENTFSDGSVIDALTQPISKVAVAQNGTCALAMCGASDELGIVDLGTGFLTDLYTHEGRVLDCCVSACGNFALVGIKAKRKGAANFVWSLKSRRIIREFGHLTGYFLPLSSAKTGGPHFLYIAQEEWGIGKPFVKTFVSCSSGTKEDDRFTEPRTEMGPVNGDEDLCKLTTVGQSCAYVLKPPILSKNEKYLAILSAKTYHPTRDLFEDHVLRITHLANGHESVLSKELLNNFVPLGSILDVRHLEEDESGILVFYQTLESSNSSGRDSSCNSTSSTDSFGGFIWDMSTMCILKTFTTVVGVDPSSLHFSDNAKYFLDSNNDLFLYAEGVRLYNLASKELQFRGFFLHGKAALFSKKEELVAYRIPERTLIGRVNLPAVVSCVSKCSDERTAVIGCESGHLLSFTLVDALIDDIPTVVATIKSRFNPDSISRSRSWDRSLPGFSHHHDEHLYPMDATHSQHSKSSGLSRDAARRKLRELSLDFDVNIDDGPGLAFRSKSCSLM